MKFRKAKSEFEIAKGLEYLNRSCPVHEICEMQTLLSWVKKHDVRIYAIVFENETLGFSCLSFVDGICTLEAISIEPKYRGKFDYVRNFVLFAELEAKRNKCSYLKAKTILPSMAKLMCDKEGFSLWYELEKKVQ